jgi:AcrR family transcriptional regulator
VQQQRTNRDKLLDGALACLRERGYRNTTSRDIARAAGVNVASINYHFGSKDALLDDALGRCFSTWNQRVQEAFDQSAATTPYGQVRAVLHATVDSFEQIRPAVYACVESYAPALRSEVLRQRLAAGYADVRQNSVHLARAALADTDLEPPESLPAIVSVLMAVIDGLMIQWIADPSATPRSAEVLQALADIGAVVTTDAPVPGAK